MDAGDWFALVAAIAGVFAVYYVGVHLGSSFITRQQLKELKDTLAKQSEKDRKDLLDKIFTLLLQREKREPVKNRLLIV